MTAGWARFAIAILLELGYVLGRLGIQVWQPEEPACELWKNAWRLVFIVIYAAFFFDWKGALGRERIRAQPFLVASIVLLLATVSGGGSEPLPFAWLLAITAPIPAMREELFYRGILQRFLVERLGVGTGIAIASVLFALQHVGHYPMQPYYLFWLSSVGVVLGVIYQRTRNIWLVIAIHMLADVWAPLRPQWAGLEPFHVIVVGVWAVIAVVVWSRTPTLERRGS